MATKKKLPNIDTLGDACRAIRGLEARVEDLAGGVADAHAKIEVTRAELDRRGNNTKAKFDTVEAQIADLRAIGNADDNIITRHEARISSLEEELRGNKPKPSKTPIDAFRGLSLPDKLRSIARSFPDTSEYFVALQEAVDLVERKTEYAAAAHKLHNRISELESKLAKVKAITS